MARFRAVAEGNDDARLLLDGDHLVGEALASGIALEVVAFVADRTPAALVARLTASLPADRLAPVSAAVLAALSPVRSPSGVAALAFRPDWPTEPMLHDPRALVLVAVEVQDPGNVGAVVRSAEAGGATAVLATAGSADPFGWKALRGSMGSALRLPLGRAHAVEPIIDTARAAGCQILAAAGSSGTSLYDLDLRGPTVILLGREGEGLPAAAIERADRRLAIPMTPPVESLNVAVAAGVIVYEARRQRLSVSDT